MNLLASEHLPWYTDPTFWTGVTFAFFAILIYRLAANPLSNALRARQSRIEDQLRQAEEAQKVVRELRLKQEERRRQAKIDAAAMVEEAKRDAERTRHELIDRAAADVEKFRRRSAREIDLAKRKAVHELADRAADLALQVAEQTLTEKLTQSDEDRLFDSAVAEMAESGGRTA